MNLEKMIDLLNEDLSREYSHWHFYIQASTAVEGLHRESISKFLLEEAEGEMKHIVEFKNLLNGLITRRQMNKSVSTKVAYFKHNLSCPKEILEQALIIEEEVVKNYFQRIDNACELQENGGEDKIDGKYIELFLENQILDSRSDADKIRMMIKKV